MAIDKSRKDKYTWYPEDLEVKMSQCSNCIHNKGKNKCEVFGRKPEWYARNEEKCPEYEKEE